MRAAVDATPLSISSGGLRRYTEELSAALLRAFPEDEFTLVPPGSGRWWSAGLPRRLRAMAADVFHGTNFAVPYVPVCPSVLTLHDLSLWMDPAWHPGPSRDRRRMPILLGLGLPTMVITPSQAIRSQAIERFRLHPGRVVSIPHGTSVQPVVPLRRNPYFLFVGTIEPRKNLPLLIEAWRAVRKWRPVDLVLAGRTRPDTPRILPEPGLCLMGEVPDAGLPDLYSGAVAFCYPSLYEGFGLPVLEAMACGRCVLTSRDPAIAELTGGEAIHLDSEPRAWVEAMRCAVQFPEWTATIGERALRRAAGFTWERTAGATREVYVEAMRRF